MPSVAAVNAQAFQGKIQQLEPGNDQGQSFNEVRLNCAEVAAALTTATTSEVASSKSAHSEPARGAVGPTMQSTTGDGSASVQSYLVNFEGDIARGQFATKIAGKDVYVTLAGHLGSKMVMRHSIQPNSKSES